MSYTTESAFPKTLPYDGEGGLTKLEYTAIHAMQGIFANEWTYTLPYEEIANRAIAVSKELLKQLEEVQE